MNFFDNSDFDIVSNFGFRYSDFISLFLDSAERPIAKNDHKTCETRYSEIWKLHTSIRQDRREHGKGAVYGLRKAGASRLLYPGQDDVKVQPKGSVGCKQIPLNPPLRKGDFLPPCLGFPPLKKGGRGDFRLGHGVRGFQNL